MKLGAIIGGQSFTRIRTWADGTIDWRRDADGSVFSHIDAATAAGYGLDAGQVASEYSLTPLPGPWYDNAGNAYGSNQVFYDFQGIMRAENGQMVMTLAQYDANATQIAALQAKQSAGNIIPTILDAPMPEAAPDIVRPVAKISTETRDSMTTFQSKPPLEKKSNAAFWSTVIGFLTLLR